MLVVGCWCWWWPSSQWCYCGDGEALGKHTPTHTQTRCGEKARCTSTRRRQITTGLWPERTRQWVNNTMQQRRRCGQIDRGNCGNTVTAVLHLKLTLCNHWWQSSEAVSIVADDEDAHDSGVAGQTVVLLLFLLVVVVSVTRGDTTLSMMVRMLDRRK